MPATDIVLVLVLVLVIEGRYAADVLACIAPKKLRKRPQRLTVQPSSSR